MKTKNRLRRIPYVLGLALLLVPGCQTTPKVNTEAKAGADFSRYRTFALLPLPQTGPTGDPGLMLRVGGPARQAVIEALTAKSFTESTRERADFSVNLRGQSIPKVEVTDLGYSRPVYTRYGQVEVVERPGTMVSTYDERTLSIEVFDNRTREMVWAGWSTRKAHGPVKPEQMTNAIHRILQQFPPTTPKPPGG